MCGCVHWSWSSYCLIRFTKIGVLGGVELVVLGALLTLSSPPSSAVKNASFMVEKKGRRKKMLPRYSPVVGWILFEHCTDSEGFLSNN